MGKFNCPSCKYEFEKGWGVMNEPDKIIKGDDEPIRLYLSNSIRIIKRDDKFYDEQTVELIACPKCKTVIIEE